MVWKCSNCSRVHIGTEDMARRLDLRADDFILTARILDDGWVLLYKFVRVGHQFGRPGLAV